MYLFGILRDFLAPKKCISCGAFGFFLCQNCLESIPKNVPFCYVCKKNSINFMVHSSCKNNFSLDALIVPYHYKEKYIKKSLTDGKFYKKREIFQELGRYIGEFVEKYLGQDTLKSTVTSVPLHIFRKWERGFNQSEYIAEQITHRIGNNYIGFLGKKQTQQQSHLNKSQRHINVKDCFLIRRKYKQKLDGMTIILVDDIVSTGASLHEASKILKQNGAKRVIGVVIASD